MPAAAPKTRAEPISTAVAPPVYLGLPGVVRFPREPGLDSPGLGRVGVLEPE